MTPTVGPMAPCCFNCTTGLVKWAVRNGCSLRFEHVRMLNRHACRFCRRMTTSGQWVGQLGSRRMVSVDASS